MAKANSEEQEEQEQQEQEEQVENSSKGKKKAAAEDDFDEESLTAAKSLYKALRDPETGKEIIESLARKAGLLDKNNKSNEGRKETEKKLGKITQKLLKGLGKDHEGFANMVGPILEEAIEEILSETTNNHESRTIEGKWEEEVDKFMDSHQLTTKIENKMKELMEDAPPNLRKSGFKPQVYLKRVYKLALEELGVEAPVERRSRREKDKNEDIEDIIERKRPKSPSTSDAVDAALAGVRWLD